jgi:hypothetical protein
MLFRNKTVVSSNDVKAYVVNPENLLQKMDTLDPLLVTQEVKERVEEIVRSSKDNFTDPNNKNYAINGEFRYFIGWISSFIQVWELTQGKRVI